MPPKPYRVFVHVESLELLPKSGRRREEVASFIRSLEFPDEDTSDFSFDDPETNRPNYVTVVAGFAVTWWIDSPVSEVKIVSIRLADLG